VQSAFTKGILASIYLMSSIPNPARAENLAQVKKGIQAAYAVRNVAAERKDMVGMMSIYAPGSTVTYPNGKVLNKGQLQKDLVNILPSVKSMVGHDFVKSISLKGNSALVQSRSKSTTISENSQTHKLDRVINNARSEDTWIKVGNKWLLKQSRIVSSVSTLNGKPVFSN
jgi:hypothetical protein